MLTKEEFYAKAADAIMRVDGFDPDKHHAPDYVADVQDRSDAIERATAVLEAVAAWDLYAAVGGIRWVGNNLHNYGGKTFETFLTAACRDAEIAAAKASA